mmetsp:Transcript_5990/g.14434  ORF Transcript_5990/g.14434 Transcript_5990/m.14434 type:complete len:159 (+) Transcript_5990:25-501(+)
MRSLLLLKCAAIVVVVGSMPIGHDDPSKQAHTTFHVKPGHLDQTHEITLDHIKCQFSFRAAHAAHGEQWDMLLVKEGHHGGKYTCTIKDMDQDPPHATFLGFSAHMFGAENDHLLSYDIWNHEGALLEGDDFIIEGNTLRSDSHWRLSGLSKVILTCT